MRGGLLADLIGLTAKVEGLHIARLHLKDELETAFSVILLVHPDVAACAKQVAILHCLVNRWKIFLQIGRRRLDRIERV